MVEVLLGAGAVCVALLAIAGCARLALGGLQSARRLADLHDIATLNLMTREQRQMLNPNDVREGMADQQRHMQMQLDAVNETVQRELHPNGGYSMHDRMREVEGYVKELKGREERSGRRVHREPTPTPPVVPPRSRRTSDTDADDRRA